MLRGPTNSSTKIRCLTKHLHLNCWSKQPLRSVCLEASLFSLEGPTYRVFWSTIQPWFIHSWNDPRPPAPPKKLKKNKFVLKCILGHFQCFEQFLFLQGRSHILFSGKYTYRGLTWYSYFWSTIKTFLLYFSGPSNHHRHCTLAIFWGS